MVESVTNTTPFPVAIGETVELDVTEQPYGPDALGRYRGLAMFVGGAVAGDRARVTVTEIHGRYARADVSEIVSPSPDRIAAKCPLFGRCGGCQWQTTTLGRQRDAKTSAVVEALRRIGKLVDPPVRATIPCRVEWAYRNKARYAVIKGDGGAGIGYFGSKAHDLVPVERCPLNLANLDSALEEAHRLLIWEPKFTHLAESIASLTARSSENTGETILRIACTKALSLADFAEALRERVPQVTGILTTGQQERSDRVAWGSEFLTEQVAELRYTVSAASFFQINPYATPDLVRVVADAANLTGTETVVDAYGGVGLFAFALAGNAKRVVLIESDAAAVRDALRMAAVTRPDNLTVVRGAVERCATDVREADVVVCDPPRDGAGKKGIDVLVSPKPKTLVYVACDPASLARDSVYLRERGYTLLWAQPLDLFPHTYHVETVALFQR